MAERDSRRRALPAGLVPRYLDRAEASAYLGVSPTTFDEEVAAGQWPPPRRRGERGTRLTWDRLRLDQYADHDSFGRDPLAQGTALPQAAAMLETPETSAEGAAMRGLIKNAPPAHRLKHRQQKAA